MLFFPEGSCARMIAANISTHPDNSRGESFWFRRIQPASTEMQDSRLKIREATVGFISFCPMICRVYATPQDITPAYRIGAQAAKISANTICSVKTAGIAHRNPQTKTGYRTFSTVNLWRKIVDYQNM